MVPEKLLVGFVGHQTFGKVKSRDYPAGGENQYREQEVRSAESKYDPVHPSRINHFYIVKSPFRADSGYVDIVRPGRAVRHFSD